MRAALVAVLLALLLVAGLLVRQLMDPPRLITLPTPTAAASGSEPVPTASDSAAIPAGGTAVASPGQELVVDVAGRVRRPGLVRLQPGARVADAIQAAGGVSGGAALQRINLAQPLSDGQQVIVPGVGDPPTQAQGGAGATGTAATGAVGGGDGAVDLNAATQDQLDALPGIGPVLAGRILQWRIAHGRFNSVDELAEVAGIGPKLLSQLRPLVRV